MRCKNEIYSTILLYGLCIFFHVCHVCVIEMANVSSRTQFGSCWVLVSWRSRTNDGDRLHSTQMFQCVYRAHAVKHLELECSWLYLREKGEEEENTENLTRTAKLKGVANFHINAYAHHTQIRNLFRGAIKTQSDDRNPIINISRRTQYTAHVRRPCLLVCVYTHITQPDDVRRTHQIQCCVFTFRFETFGRCARKVFLDF